MSANPIRLQVRLYPDEDPELYALFTAMDKGSRARRVRAALRYHHLSVNHGEAMHDQKVIKPKTATPARPASVSQAAPIASAKSEPMDYSNTALAEFDVNTFLTGVRA